MPPGSPNHERSRVWYGREGFFIVWPNAVTEIRKLLEGDELPGIPKAPDTILEILLGAGVFESRERRTARSGSSSLRPGKTVFEAVKLAAPEILLHGHGQTVIPLSTPLVSKAGATTASVSTPASAKLVPIPAASDPPAAEAQPADGTITPGLDLLGDPLTGHAVGPEPEHDSPGIEALPEVPAEATAASPPIFRLVAPLRLNPLVRDTLAAAVASMNGDSRTADAITGFRRCLRPARGLQAATHRHSRGAAVADRNRHDGHWRQRAVRHRPARHGRQAGTWLRHPGGLRLGPRSVRLRPACLRSCHHARAPLRNALATGLRTVGCGCVGWWPLLLRLPRRQGPAHSEHRPRASLPCAADGWPPTASGPRRADRPGVAVRQGHAGHHDTQAGSPDA
jgi:hypothetical protein